MATGGFSSSLDSLIALIAARRVCELVEVEIVLQFHPHRHRLAIFHCRRESNGARRFDRLLSQSMWKFAHDAKIRHFAIFREHTAENDGSGNAELARALRISWLRFFEHPRLLRNLTAAEDAVIIFGITPPGTWSDTDNL